ncbi:MAG TPA: PilZ domain-containing protein [Candidatus Cybelea sp.]|nr:PilZ domain-containing protein [Candidatus Cybelea sp.]
MTEDPKQRRPVDRRVDPRFVVNLPAHVTIRGERVLCKLVDISEHGALIETSGPVHVGDKVSLDVPKIGPTIATVLRITPTHMAMVFPGAVVISSLVPKD